MFTDVCTHRCMCSHVGMYFSRHMFEANLSTVVFVISLRFCNISVSYENEEIIVIPNLLVLQSVDYYLSVDTIFLFVYKTKRL